MATALNIDKGVRQSSDGSYPKSKSNAYVFLERFACDYVAKLPEAQRLVEVKVHEPCKLVVLRFNDIDKFSSFYCDYKEESGKLLNRDLKKRKDNFKNTLAQYVADSSLEKVGSGKCYSKEFLEYEVKESGLSQLLTSNFSVQKILCSQHVNFHACHGETSSDTGIGLTQSDDQFDNQRHGHFQEGSSVSSSEPSLDTRGVSKIDVQLDDKTHENSRESRGVISSEPSSDTGDVSQSDVQPVDETMLADFICEMDLDSLCNEFDESFFDQINLSTNDLPSLSTAVDENIPELTIVPEFCNIETHENSRESRGVISSEPSSDTGDVSQSDVQPVDEINLSTNDLPSLSTAVDENIAELTIVPEFCNIEGGGQFIVRANQNLPEGTYKIQFGDYGTCKAWGSGSKHLDGSDNIPAARRRGTHFVMVQVFDVRGQSIGGGIPFEYRDNKVNRYRTELVKNSKSLSGSNPHNEPHPRKQKSSSNSMQYPGLNKRSKSGPVDMPMVMYFCDEMAKGGDEDFFSALKKIGILAEVLANRSEYYKDFAITAKEHGHNELAEMLAVPPRELPCDGDMETLTIGKLLDAVQQERSLANSDPVISDSEDDSNSCSSGYNGDCDSDDLNNEEESLNDVIIREAESPSDGHCCTNGSLKENEDKTDSVLGNWNSHYDDVDVEKKEHIFEDENSGEKTSLVERSLNPNQEETVAGVNNKTTDSGCCPLLTKPVDVEKEHIFEDEDNEEKTSLVERSLNPNQEETVAGVNNKTTGFGCWPLLTKPLESIFESEYVPRANFSIFEDWRYIGHSRTSSLVYAVKCCGGKTAGYVEVKMGIVSGADVNEKDEENKTALHYASECGGSSEIVKYLVENGADINAKDEKNKTALHYATERRASSEIARYVYFWEVARHLPSLEIVKYLVEHGADINEKDEKNKTALHYAAERGSLEIVKYLVEHGADINAKDEKNKTALHYAAKRRSLEIVKCLVEHGADVNEKDEKNKTALQYAAKRGSLEIVKYLVQHGADEWNYALIRACYRGKTAAVRALMNAKVDIQNVEDLIRRSDEVINTIELDLKKSIKPGQKIRILKAMDNEKLTKVGLALKYFAPDESLSIRTGSVRIMEDGSEVAVTMRMMAQTEMEVAGSVKHLPEHGARMIKEILNVPEFLHDQGILRRDLKPSHVVVVVGSMKLADFGMSHVLNKVGSLLKSSSPHESLSIGIASARRSVCVGVIEDDSEMSMRIMILPETESEVAAGSVKHLQEHGPRVIEEIITGQTLI